MARRMLEGSSWRLLIRSRVYHISETNAIFVIFETLYRSTPGPKSSREGGGPVSRQGTCFIGCRIPKRFSFPPPVGRHAGGELPVRLLSRPLRGGGGRRRRPD